MAGEPVFEPAINPSFPVEDDREPRLRSTNFGDGYEQITRDGLNHDAMQTQLRWENITRAEGAPIFAFFEARGGDQPFLYEVPFTGVQKKWTAPRYRRRFHEPDAMTIEVTLKQNFRP